MGKREGRRTTLQLVAEFSAGTLELGLSVAIGAFIGYLLDRWLDPKYHTAPWLTLFWLLCGVLAGFRSLIRVARRLEKAEGQNDGDGNSS